MEQYKYSLFWKKGDNTKNITPLKEITTAELVDIIRSPKLKDTPKKQRPYITPYGTFSKRNNNSLKTFNKNLVCLDYDNLSEFQLRYIISFWCLRSSVLLCLPSPSGKGVKVLIRCRHSFEPKALFDGLKHNTLPFCVGQAEPDIMQFVLSQPMFIPYCETPYFNPEADIENFRFKTPKKEVYKPIEIDYSKLKNDKTLDRVNKWFIGRVEHCLNSLESRPIEAGTHTYLWSVIMRLYPYLDQQTAVTETEITDKLTSIVLQRYEGNRSEVNSLHRSIKIAKTYKLSLIDEINKTATYKIA